MPTTRDKKNDTNQTKATATLSNTLSLTGQSAFSESSAELLTSAKVEGKGMCSLYKDNAGRFFVRTVAADNDSAVRVSGRAAARIVEREARQRLNLFLSARLDVPIRVKDDAGKIYDTARDKRHFQTAYSFEAVSAHETREGCLYFRFVDAYEDRVMILNATAKRGNRPDIDSENKETLEYLSVWIERCALSDRSFLGFMDKAIDWVDGFLECEIITVKEREELYPWTESLRDGRRGATEVQ